MTKRRKRKIHKGRVSTLLGIVILIVIVGLHSIEAYNTPKLYGTWQSTSTDKKVTFNTDGKVILDDGTEAVFEIISPNSRMNYSIDNKHFEMIYSLEGRTLHWGLNEKNLEVFNRD